MKTQHFPKVILAVIALPVFTLLLAVQDVRKPNDFNNDLELLISQFEEEIGDQNQCRQVQSKLRLLHREMRTYFRSHADEKVANQSMLDDINGFKGYVACITNSNASLMGLDQFKVGCRLIGGSFEYLEKGAYCLEVIKHRVGDYLCYLAFNTDNENGRNYVITYVLDTPSLNKKGILNSIVLGGQIDLIVDNRNWTNERYLTVSEIKCEAIQ